MTGLGFLIPIALALGFGGLAVFFWAMRNGQFDDLEGAANRILIEDEEEEPVVRSDPGVAPDDCPRFDPAQ